MNRALQVLAAGVGLVLLTPAAALVAPLTLHEVDVAGAFTLGDDVVVARPGRQVEFSIAANPLDPDNLVVVGDAVGSSMNVFTSHDGGATWAHQDMPATGYTSGAYGTVAFGADGVAYAGWWAYRAGYAHAVVLSTSTDGGDTWTTRATPHESPGLYPFERRGMIATGPAPGEVVMAWDHYTEEGLLGYGLIRTTDGGVTWSPLVIHPGNDAMPLAGAAGELFIIRRSADGPDLVMDRSVDGGRTMVSTPVMPSMYYGSLDLMPWTMWSYPSIARAAGGPHAGRLYVAAPIPDEVTGADLAVARSDDRGATWTVEVLPRPGMPVFQALAVMPDGTVGVSFLDTALYPMSNTPLWSRATLSNEAPLVHSLSWQRPGRDWHTTILTDVPTFAGVTRWWGNYEGLAATPRGFHPAFADGRGQPPCEDCTYPSPEAPLDFATLRWTPP